MIKSINVYKSTKSINLLIRILFIDLFPFSVTLRFLSVKRFPSPKFVASIRINNTVVRDYFQVAEEQMLSNLSQWL